MHAVDAIIVSSIIYALLAQKTMVQLLTVYVWLRIGRNDSDGAFLVAVAQDAAGFAAAVSYSLGRAGLLYVIVAPLVMSVVALVASDPFARRWGPVRCCWDRSCILCFARCEGKRKRRVLTQRTQRTQSTQRRKKKSKNTNGQVRNRDSVPCAGKRERPRVTAAQAEWRAAKRYAIEGNVVELAADEAGEFHAEPGGGGDAVARKTRGKVHAVNFPASA